MRATLLLSKLCNLMSSWRANSQTLARMRKPEEHSDSEVLFNVCTLLFFQSKGRILHVTESITSLRKVCEGYITAGYITARIVRLLCLFKRVWIFHCREDFRSRKSKTCANGLKKEMQLSETCVQSPRLVVLSYQNCVYSTGTQDPRPSKLFSLCTLLEQRTLVPFLQHS